MSEHVLFELHRLSAPVSLCVYSEALSTIGICAVTSMGKDQEIILHPQSDCRQLKPS